MAYTLYLMTYGLDSVADVFGSLFAFAAGVLVIVLLLTRQNALPDTAGGIE